MPYQQTDKTYILHKFFNSVIGLKRTFLWGISFCAYNFGHMLEAPKGLFAIPDLSE